MTLKLPVKETEGVDLGQDRCKLEAQNRLERARAHVHDLVLRAIQYQ